MWSHSRNAPDVPSCFKAAPHFKDIQFSHACSPQVCCNAAVPAVLTVAAAVFTGARDAPIGLAGRPAAALLGKPSLPHEPIEHTSSVLCRAGCPACPPLPVY